jgi:hypothetical protein
VQEGAEVGLGESHFFADEGEGWSGLPFGEQLAESRRRPYAVHLVVDHFPAPCFPKSAVMSEL